MRPLCQSVNCCDPASQDVSSHRSCSVTHQSDNYPECHNTVNPTSRTVCQLLWSCVQGCRISQVLTCHTILKSPPVCHTDANPSIVKYLERIQIYWNEISWFSWSGRNLIHFTYIWSNMECSWFCLTKKRSILIYDKPKYLILTKKLIFYVLCLLIDQSFLPKKSFICPFRGVTNSVLLFAWCHLSSPLSCSFQKLS